MTPKEKAEELVDKMRDEIPCHCDDWEQAKQCALIAVDEVIDQWEYIYVHIADGMGELNPNLKYWKEVKREIENL